MPVATFAARDAHAVEQQLQVVLRVSDRVSPAIGGAPGSSGIPAFPSDCHAASSSERSRSGRITAPRGISLTTRSSRASDGEALVTPAATIGCAGGVVRQALAA